MNYKRIYHISDIHIRNTEYHIIEYLHVFDNLYKYLESFSESDKNEGLIVITGDILHNKDRLTPLCISLCVDFLSKLANIMTTIIIAGNHDFNMKNLEQQDALSSILYKRKINNLHYLRESGIYNFNNILFGVSSLIDNKFISANEIETSDKIKIGLYHGAVSNSRNSIGFEFSDKSITKFDGYDLVLLGDIHYYQYLNEEKTIAYSSSLISQNFSETDDNHGVLVWNLENKTSFYKIIENEYRYQELTITDDFDINNLILPPRCRLRINTKSNIDYLIVKQIKKKYPLITIKENYLSNKINNSSINQKEILKEDSLITIINKEIDNIDCTIKEEVKDLLLTDLSESLINVSERNNIKLLSLEFSNLLTYGPNNKFNFDRLTFDEITGLIGKNSSGKSSLIDIILFSLFNKYSRNYIDVSKSERTISAVMINNNYDTFESIVKLESNGDIYEIIKSGKRQGKKKSYLFDTIKFIKYDFYKNSKKLSEATNKDTQKLINSVIGEYDNFCLSTICLQNSSKIKFDFFEMSIYARKEFLNNLLKMHIFEEVENKYKLLLSLLNKEILILSSSDNNKNIDSDLIDNLSNEINIYNINHIKYQNELLSYKNEFNNIITKMLPINENYKNYDICYCKDLLLKLEQNNNSNESIDELIKKLKPTTINITSEELNIIHNSKLNLELINNKKLIIKNNKLFEEYKNIKLIKLKSKLNQNLILSEFTISKLKFLKLIYKNIPKIDIDKILNKNLLCNNIIDELEKIPKIINNNILDNNNILKNKKINK